MAPQWYEEAQEVVDEIVDFMQENGGLAYTDSLTRLVNMNRLINLAESDMMWNGELFDFEEILYSRIITYLAPLDEDDEEYIKGLVSDIVCIFEHEYQYTASLLNWGGRPRDEDSDEI